jgi:hypothetical protein
MYGELKLLQFNSLRFNYDKSPVPDERDKVQAISVNEKVVRR